MSETETRVETAEDDEAAAPDVTPDQAPDVVSKTVPAIEAHQLTKRFGSVTAISEVTFTVERGTVVGFLGPNGAGKSTTMRILTGLTAASSGRAYVCGISVARDADAIKRCIGYLPENNPLPDDLRVSEYLSYRGKLKGLHGKRLKARIQDAMEVCDLHRKARRKIIRTLSKGFRQRVGIAEAILAEPEVIIMDEPTIGLDPHQIIAMRGLIRSLRERMTVMLSSHILPEIEACCDRVIIINQGRIVANATPAQLHNEFLPGQRLRLQLDGPTTRIENLLPDVASELQIESVSEADADGFRHYTVRAESTEGLPERLLKILQSNGVRVRELALIKPGLEDVFLAATKRSWEHASDT